MKRSFNVFLLLISSLWMMNGWSACQLQTKDGKPAIPLTTNLDITMSASSVIDNNMLGGRYGNLSIDLEGGNSHKISCDKDDQMFIEYKTSKPFNSIINNTPYTELFLYPTEINGLAWALPNFNKKYLLGCNNNGHAVKECLFNNREDSVIKLQAELIRNDDTQIISGVVHGSSIPSVTILAGQSNSMIPVAYFSFSGTLTINNPTCTTPDVQVQMGKWDVSEFKGPDKATEWRDASIYFTKCDTFYGTYNHKYLSADTGSLIFQTGPWSHWRASLNPQSGIFDRKRGIINIKPGSQSATGVGIQLAKTTSGSVFDFDEPWNGLIVSGKNSFHIPLFARYIQTDRNITPGVADGRALLTISYK